MQHSVAIYGKLLLVIGVMGYLAGGTAEWAAIGPALLGIIVLAVTRGPLRTSSATVAGTAGTLIAMLALCSSANAVADIPRRDGRRSRGGRPNDSLPLPDRPGFAGHSVRACRALAARGVIGRGPEDAAADVSAEHRDC